MKKLLAILLSALMLCTMIPFATVSASDEPTIVVSTDAEEYNAGDEIEVTVELLNNPGVIAATVEILYDHDALELVTYFDEDEEMWMPQIEVGSGFNASSNKYITFGPINDDTGVAEKCVVSYIRGTAKSDCVKELFFTATFKVKDDAASGNYDLTISYDPANFFNVEMVDVAFGKEDTSIAVNGTDPLPPACDHEYDNACDVDCNKCGETREVEHNNVHVAAVAPTCYENGNIEYWYCDVCGQAWLDEACTLNTNLLAVILPMAHAEATHVAAVAPTCYENGNIEYWYCADCGQAWLDAECTLNTNLKAVVLPMAHGEIIAVEAVAPTCYENGNIAYWYCADCGQAWLDADCTLNTNLKAVVLPAAGHSYTNDHDASCDVCGAERDIVLSADEIILFGGNSVSEQRNGLAFKFDVAVNGITWDEEYTADYTNATVTIEGVEYKLVGMGAIANNKGYAAQTLADVDGIYVLNIPAVKVFADASNAACFAVRIINIPEANLDTEITIATYYQYECDGEIITVYGADVATSYNAEI